MSVAAAARSAPVRVIARLDVKAPNLVKGVHLEGLRVLGKPADFAQRYYEQGIDEIVYTDIVASLYGRNSILELVSETARNVFVPISVGGGIRAIEDVRAVLRSGADKVCVNTAGIRNPPLLRQIAETFGSQCLVVAIETIRGKDGAWRCFTDNGREATGRLALEWAEEAASLGAGEILMTSVDREGTFRGFEVELLRLVSQRVAIPVIAHGGAGSAEDAVKAVAEGGADAVAIAGLFHYARAGIADVKQALARAGIEVRPAENVAT